MNEQEWARCSDPQAMLSSLRDTGRANQRKLRLFAAACCRRVWPLLKHPQFWRAVELTELVSRGLADDAARQATGEEALEVLAEMTVRRAATRLDGTPSPSEWAASAAHCTAADDPGKAAKNAARAGGREDESAWQCQALRDIVGNPFRPPVLDPAWLGYGDDLIVRLAQAIDAEGSFEQLPILADALEDAGCQDQDILGHLREPDAVHVRGCHVIDLLTGRDRMAGSDRRTGLYQAVHEVLFREWDPIGINHNPLVQDEYDSYAPTICRMLEGGADEVKLATHLRQLRTEAMGLPDGVQQQEHDRRVTSSLRRLVE